MINFKWFDIAYLREIFGCSVPKKVHKAKESSRLAEWKWVSWSAAGTVKAFTKSEARAKFKEKSGLYRLPKGTVIQLSF